MPIRSDTYRLDWIARVCGFERELLQDCPGDGNTVIWWDDPLTGKQQCVEGLDLRDCIDRALDIENERHPKLPQSQEKP